MFKPLSEKFTMPELPEVETTARGIRPHIVKHSVANSIVRNRSLRWPVTQGLEKAIQGKALRNVTRRGKYLILDFGDNCRVLWHLGMSGSLRIAKQNEPPLKHDHIDIVFSNGAILRYCDPRRFGAVLMTFDPVEQHKLIHHLGPEPLSDSFSGEYLFKQSRKKTQSVKTWIMSSQVVVGVGNIYANEALFNTRIHPLKKAGKLTKAQCNAFCHEIKTVLAYAIKRGGTTLRDFVGGDGKPGYFAQELNVYGRKGQPCVECQKPLTEKRLTGRSTVYCTACQK